MKLLFQPLESQLGDILQENLQSGEFERVHIVVAFAKNSGVLRLRKAMKEFLENGGEIHFYVGVDMNGTSFEALSNLLPITTTLRVVHDSNGQTFHTKLYSFTSSKRSVVTVGSNNFTGGGLWTSYETAVQLNLDPHNPRHKEVQRDVEEYLARLRALTNRVQLLSSQADIDALLENCYVDKEVSARLRSNRVVNIRGRHQELFGSGKKAFIPAIERNSLQPPREALQQDQQSRVEAALSASTIFSPSEEPTLWLETRRMTGGSRNILDLSKTSLLHSGNVVGTAYQHENPRFMRGAVEFFGVNPEAVDLEREIAVNFEGEDYYGNTIKFPKGDRSNGTWRVQLKGVSKNGEKITSVFKRLAQGGHFLPGKIVTFTRVASDYYYMSVFDDRELPEFINASSVTAFNGRVPSAKMLGIL